MQADTVAAAMDLDRREGRAAWILPVLLMAASLLCAAWLDLAPRPGQPVLAVFPPWWNRAGALKAMVAADGDLVSPGRWPDMLIAASLRTGLGMRLHGQGAWLLLDPRGLAGCAASSRSALK